jgi:hypothetical protein
MAKASVAWKVRVYEDGGALSEEQIQRLAENFAIDPELVKRLSEDLANALHPQKWPKSVRKVVDSRKKGAAELAKAINDLRSAQKKN